MKTALTIAGSDSSGGAGIQADIKTMIANGVYAMSAITALTAQNTTDVTAIMEASDEFLGKQLDAVFTDIRPDAVKIGMVSSGALIHEIAQKLREYKAVNIVVDPVMIASSGAKLISDEAIDVLADELLPLATILTPNIPEAEVLTGMKIKTSEDMVRAARQISEAYGCNVLCKGGHLEGAADDVLYKCDSELEGSSSWVVYPANRVDNPNTHGTGCTLSSAIAANLAKDYSIEYSVKRAKAYVTGALEAMLDLGHGCGPMDHGFELDGYFLR